MKLSWVRHLDTDVPLSVQVKQELADEIARGEQAHEEMLEKMQEVRRLRS